MCKVNQYSFIKILSILFSITICFNLFIFIKEYGYTINTNILEEAFVISWSSIICFAMCLAGNNMPKNTFKRHIMFWSFSPNLFLMFIFALYIGIGSMGQELNESGLILMVPLLYPVIIIPASFMFGIAIWFAKKYWPKTN